MFAVHENVNTPRKRLSTRLTFSRHLISSSGYTVFSHLAHFLMELIFRPFTPRWHQQSPDQHLQYFPCPAIFGDVTFTPVREWFRRRYCLFWIRGKLHSSLATTPTWSFNWNCPNGRARPLAQQRVLPADSLASKMLGGPRGRCGPASRNSHLTDDWWSQDTLNMFFPWRTAYCTFGNYSFQQIC